jgi:hypothetical protein
MKTLATILVIVSLCSCSIQRQTERQYHWADVVITSIKHPYKGASHWEITWTCEKVDYKEPCGDTSGTGYFIGLRHRTLIQR